MIRYKIYQNQQKKGLNVEAQFTVFQWGDQRRAH